MTPAHRPDWQEEGRSVGRTICVGGLSKALLLAKLQEAGVQMNEAALTLFADERFTTSSAGSWIEIVETSVADLGCPAGATFAEIVAKAAGLGLLPCRLDTGPHLRLQFLDQPEGCLGHPPPQHGAPSGSITVISLPLADDDETPKGFYLRRIKDTLWLRGYRASLDHLWSPEDRLLFTRCPPVDPSADRA